MVGSVRVWVDRRVGVCGGALVASIHHGRVGGHCVTAAGGRLLVWSMGGRRMFMRQWIDAFDRRRSARLHGRVARSGWGRASGDHRWRWRVSR